MKMMKFHSASLLSVTLSVFLLGAAPTVSASVIPQATMVEFENASLGDQSATKSAYEKLLKLDEKNPGNPLIKTVLGSTETMLGRDAWMPWNKMKHVERGLARMDKAIELLGPEHMQETFFGLPLPIWVQTTVGCTFVEMPQIFNRLNAGSEILEETLELELMQYLPFEGKSSTYLCAAIAAEKAGKTEEALKYAGAIIENAPESQEASRAKEMVTRLKG
ncbi:hypothetical protein MHO82_02080 [Vibrio sp. Of7-15]|uniref:tetratricopeptide repeat protein n=1 Tax=Vibrio sp. Of7-15 TaxID=2724879 RepID=UPI001EF3693F|nr:hypothetical protein [Vibrio sp. Of7-15]MCG7495644.1 hypothetical protein [Vibrio sp. Of7-15]